MKPIAWTFRFLATASRWIGTVLLWVSFALFVSPVFLVPVLIIWFKIEEMFRRDVAAELIAVAEKNRGLVDLKIFGDRVCVFPGYFGYISRSEILELYPGREITYMVSDESHGRWVVVIPEAGSEINIEVYTIGSLEIKWEHDKNLPYHQQIHCPEFMRLTQVDGKWTYRPEFD